MAPRRFSLHLLGDVQALQPPTFPDVGEVLLEFLDSSSRGDARAEACRQQFFAAYYHDASESLHQLAEFEGYSPELFLGLSSFNAGPSKNEE